ncbi:MAG: hypothetical protein ACOYKM_07580 [Caulobacterales bacterium]
MNAHALFTVGAAVTLMCAVGSCGRAPSAPPLGLVGTSAFDRPCSILTPALATAVAQRPYFRTLSADLVEDNVVTCIQALGPGGVQAVAQVVVHLPLLSGAPEVRYVALCRGDAPSMLGAGRPDVPRIKANPGAHEVTSMLQGVCALPHGGMAVLLADRVLEVTVEGGDGMMQRELTERLAQAVQARGAEIAGTLSFSQAG